MNLEGNTSIALMQAAQQDSQDKLSSAKQAGTDKDMERINEVAKDFEAMFMTEMLKPMFEQIKPNETFGGGKGEEIFRGMMLQEYGKMMAERSELGIADSVKGQLIQMQAEANGERSVIHQQVQTSANNNSKNNDPLTQIIEEQLNVQ